MIDIYFDKLYRYNRLSEPCYIGIPVREGVIWDTDGVRVYQAGNCLPLQTKVTSRHKDGSVRFLFLRFLADLPGNKNTMLQCDLHGAPRTEQDENKIWTDGCSSVNVAADQSGVTVSTNCKFSFRVGHNGQSVFEWLDADWQMAGC